MDHKSDAQNMMYQLQTFRPGGPGGPGGQTQGSGVGSM